MNLPGTSSRLIFVFALILLLLGLSPQNSSAQTQTSAAILLSNPTPVAVSAEGASFTSPTIIASKTLTLSCPAVPTATLSNTQDGSGYVLVDNYLTLAVNGSLVTNPNADSTPFSPAGNVCTGGVTDGFNNTTQQDCFSQAYRNAAVANSILGDNTDSLTNPNNSVLPPGAGAGPAGGVPPISIGSFLPANSTSQVSIQLLDAGGYTASSSLYLVTNCSAPQQVTQPSPIPITGDTSNVDLVAAFGTADVTLTTDITYKAPNGLTPSSGVTSPVLVTTNNQVPAGTWPQYVVGTPWATSQCTVKLANGGTTLCSLFINACFQQGADPSSASDANCPTVTSPDDNNFIILQDTFDWGNGKWIPTPGMTASLIAFTVPTSAPLLQWAASDISASTNEVCPTQVSTSPLPCYLTDTLLDITGDQTTTKGSKPKSKAWLASAVNVPMLATSINLTAPTGSGLTCSPTLNAPPANSNGFASSIWNNGACILDFVASPPSPSATNYFQAAQPSFLEFGFLPGTPTPPAPPIEPGALPAGDKTITNGNPVLTCVGSVCTATSWDTGFNKSLASIFVADGTYTLHWSAKDTAGITEKNITLTDPGNAPCTSEEAMSTTCNYLTSYFTTVVNIDSVPPQQDFCETADGVWHATNVTLGCKAHDATSGVANSNGPTIPGLPAPGTTPVSFGLSTSVPVGMETNSAATGTQQLCDYAGNCNTFGPIGGNMIDEKPPVISVTAPTSGQVFPAYSSAASAFTCLDGGSGTKPLPAGCNGRLAPSATSNVSGGLLDTKPTGPGLTAKSLTVASVDNVGNVAAPVSVNYSVSCHFASAQLSSSTLPKGISFQPAATMLTDCVPTAQKAIVTLTLTGPFGASCSTNTQLLFFPIPVTIQPNTNKSPLSGVLLIVPKTACSGRSFTFSTNTYDSTGKTLLDSVSQAVTVK